MDIYAMWQALDDGADISKNYGAVLVVEYEFSPCSIVVGLCG